MAIYKVANSLCPADAAYIAGLIDGEGTITLTRKHKNENRRLAVTISSTEMPLLQFVLDTAGVGIITNKKASRAHHTPSYSYAVYNRQALQLLEQIHFYLRSYKTQRSALALAEYLCVTPRNGKYSIELQKLRSDFEERFFAIKP